MIGLTPFGCSPIAGLSTRAVGAVGATVVLDSSPNGRHGTYIGDPALGSPTLVPGDRDQSIGFPDPSAYCYLGDNSGFSFPANVFTIEFWYQDPSASSSAGILGKHGDPWEYSVYRIGTSIYFRAWSSTGDIVYGTNYGPVGTNAHHYAWIADGSFARLYVDGSLINTVAKSTYTMSDTSAPLVIGVGGPNPSEVVGANFDTVTIGLTEDRTVFVRIATGDTISLGYVDTASVTSTTPPSSAPLVQVITSDTLSVSIVEPEDVTYDMVSTGDTLSIGQTNSTAIVNVTGGVRSDVVRLTQFSVAGMPGKRYRQPATRTVGILTRLSPAGMPGRA
jgi:hypothetical protein